MTASRLIRESIDVARLVSAVSDDACGAAAVFIGTVRHQNDGRPVEGIEYTAYEAMADAELERVIGEVKARHPGLRVAVLHRLGLLRVGEASVAIACVHPHRAPALDACRYVIEELKRRVPIWKRELYTDGTREWVDPTRPHARVTSP